MQQEQETVDTQQENDSTLAGAVIDLVHLAEDNPDGIMVMDSAGTYLFVNHEAERILGTLRENLLGKTVWDVFREATTSKELFRQHFDRAINERLASSYDVFAVSLERWMHVHLIPSSGHPTAQGDTNRVIVHFHDVTAQHIPGSHLPQSEEKFRALADNMAQFAWMADATGAIFWYNRRWFDYTGTTLEEMKGWGWQKVHHPDHVQAVTEKFQYHIRTGQPWEDTFPLRNTDGTYGWFLSRAFPITNENGDITLWCGTNTDITEQRQITLTLKQREERVRALYEMTARTDIEFGEKVAHLLALVKEWLGLDVGVFARTDCTVGTYKVLEIVSPDPTVPRGFTCPLDQTFCSETVKQARHEPPLAIEHIGQDAVWSKHPAYTAFGGEAYVAAPVWTTDDLPWGTISFVSGKPHTVRFTEFDKDLVRLIAQWIGGEIQRQRIEEALHMSASQQRRFVRDMLASVTEGRLLLCDGESDLPSPLSASSDAIELTPTSLRLLRRNVMTTASELHFSTDREQDLITAVGEAGMNAIIHGGGGTGKVYFDTEARTIQVWIQDRGTGIRQEDLHRATLEKGWSGGGTLGHGFFLMLRTCDRTYLLTGPQGTTVVLVQESIQSEPQWLQSVAAEPEAGN